MQGVFSPIQSCPSFVRITTYRDAQISQQTPHKLPGQVGPSAVELLILFSAVQPAIRNLQSHGAARAGPSGTGGMTVTEWTRWTKWATVNFWRKTAVKVINQAINRRDKRPVHCILGCSVAFISAFAPPSASCTLVSYIPLISLMESLDLLVIGAGTFPSIDSVSILMDQAGAALLPSRHTAKSTLLPQYVCSRAHPQSVASGPRTDCGTDSSPTTCAARTSTRTSPWTTPTASSTASTSRATSSSGILSDTRSTLASWRTSGCSAGSQSWSITTTPPGQ